MLIAQFGAPQQLRRIGPLPDHSVGQVASSHNPNEMVSKFQSRVNLHIRHVAANAVSLPPAIRVHTLAAVAGMAFFVVKGRIAAGILVRGMARCAA